MGGSGEAKNTTIDKRYRASTDTTSESNNRSYSGACLSARRQSLDDEGRDGEAMSRINNQPDSQQCDDGMYANLASLATGKNYIMIRR